MLYESMSWRLRAIVYTKGKWSDFWVCIDSWVQNYGASFQNLSASIYNVYFVFNSHVNIQ